MPEFGEDGECYRTWDVHVQLQTVTVLPKTGLLNLQPQKKGCWHYQQGSSTAHGPLRCVITHHLFLSSLKFPVIETYRFAPFMNHKIDDQDNCKTF